MSDSNLEIQFTEAVSSSTIEIDTQTQNSEISNESKNIPTNISIEQDKMSGNYPNDDRVELDEKHYSDSKSHLGCDYFAPSNELQSLLDTDNTFDGLNQESPSCYQPASISSLYYGPPSGSSVPSLLSVNSTSYSKTGKQPTTDLPGNLESNIDDTVPLVMQYVTVTQTAGDMKSAAQPPQETDINNFEHWMTMELPSRAKSMCASENCLIFLDSCNYLFVGNVDHGNKSCSWKKAPLPFEVSLVNVSGSGETIWLVSEGNVYQCTKSNKRTYGTEDNAQYLLNARPLAVGVVQVCGTDRYLYYVNQDLKVSIICRCIKFML